MSRTHANARSFVVRGVDVMSVPEFVRGFVGQTVTAELETHPGCLIHPNTSELGCDDILHWTNENQRIEPTNNLH